MAATGTGIAAFLEAQVRAFEELRPTYEVMSRLLFRILSQAKRDLGVSGVVQTRTKELSSFAEKAMRKRTVYPDPARTVDDLCGGRVIVTSKDDISVICRVLQRRLRIVESEDALERLAVSEFGYRSVHFVVAFDKAQLRDLLKRLEDEEFTGLISGFAPAGFPGDAEERKTWLCDYLCQHETEARRDQDRMPDASPIPQRPRFRAEIQVRSLLQHAWAEFSHDRFYKSGFEIPRRWERMLSRIAANLEEADDAFASAANNLDKYRTYYGAYISRSAREKELANLQAVLQHEHGNRRVACRAARMAMSLGQFATARSILQPFAMQWNDSAEGQRLQILYTAKIEELNKTLRDADKLEKTEEELDLLQNHCDSEVIMDYGWSAWKSDDPQQGRRYLEWAVALDPRNIDARLFLAEAYLNGPGRNPEMALRQYAHAFENAPTNPEVLVGFLFCKLCLDGNTDSVSMARVSLDAAIELCQERIRAKIDLPHAFYKMGFFFLLLGKPYHALNAYAKAVVLSESTADISREYERVLELQGQKAVRNAMPELEWIQRFLVAAQRAKALQLIRLATTDIEDANNELKRLQSPGGLASEEEEKRDRISALQRAIGAVEELRKDALAAAASALEKCRSLLKQCGASPRELLADPFLAMVRDQPVIIVAGGCAQRYEDKIQSYRGMFQDVFQEYRGLIFSGCTTSGVNRLVGDTCQLAGELLTPIAFVPQTIPAWTKLHRAFTRVVMTDGERFSALDLIMNWIYLLASGKNPSEVRLLGINGGSIAAFEFRMALAMGARVGILGDSGRAAAEILEDPDWRDTPGLFRLPNDPGTVKLFVCSFKACPYLSEHDREELAKMTHEEYRMGQLHGLMKREPNLRTWDELPPDLKESNLQQIDFIEHALGTLSLAMQRVDGSQGDDDDLYKFEKCDEDHLAQLEHARWNIERLFAGWRLGPKKDIGNKVTPYLVSWAELPDDVKKYDYDAVRAIPHKVRSLGYKIVDLRKKGQATETCGDGQVSA